jgi:recombination protein RecA
MRKHKVALIVINQIRSKVGVIYGNPEKPAAGGRSLEYYLGVNLKCISNKTSDLIRDEHKSVIGIKGTVRNTKNKVSIPFRECEFELMYNEGLNPYAGVLKQLEAAGKVQRSGAWYTVDGTEKKFQAKEFIDLLLAPDTVGFEPLRKFFGI